MKSTNSVQSIGGFIALAGIISIVLHFMGYNLRILFWVDLWGPVIAWIIRIGLVVIGAVLFFAGSINKKPQTTDEAPKQQ